MKKILIIIICALLAKVSKAQIIITTEGVLQNTGIQALPLILATDLDAKIAAYQSKDSLHKLLIPQLAILTTKDISLQSQVSSLSGSMPVLTTDPFGTSDPNGYVNQAYLYAATRGNQLNKGEADFDGTSNYKGNLFNSPFDGVMDGKQFLINFKGANSTTNPITLDLDGTQTPLMKLRNGRYVDLERNDITDDGWRIVTADKGFNIFVVDVGQKTQPFSGDNMGNQIGNGSRISNIANGINATDAVTKGQIDALLINYINTSNTQSVGGVKTFAGDSTEFKKVVIDASSKGNPLVLKGVQAGVSADSLLSIDANGIVKRQTYLTASNLVKLYSAAFSGNTNTPENATGYSFTVPTTGRYRFDFAVSNYGNNTMQTTTFQVRNGTTVLASDFQTSFNNTTHNEYSGKMEVDLLAGTTYNVKYITTGVIVVQDYLRVYYKQVSGLLPLTGVSLSNVYQVGTNTGIAQSAPNSILVGKW
ncbi:MAG: hypothetical protein U5L45_00285 [Saprospiraceae bacterium]|nr:hypothetical protein [Saprospiraceae bacterium]